MADHTSARENQKPQNASQNADINASLWPWPGCYSGYSGYSYGGYNLDEAANTYHLHKVNDISGLTVCIC